MPTGTWCIPSRSSVPRSNRARSPDGQRFATTPRGWMYPASLRPRSRTSAHSHSTPPLPGSHIMTHGVGARNFAVRRSSSSAAALARFSTSARTRVCLENCRVSHGESSVMIRVSSSAEGFDAAKSERHKSSCLSGSRIFAESSSTLQGFSLPVAMRNNTMATERTSLVAGSVATSELCPSDGVPEPFFSTLCKPR